MRSVIPAVFVAVGLVFLALGIYVLRDARGFARRAQRVPGVVVRLVSRSSSGPPNQPTHRRELYHPVLAFRTLEGEDRQIESDVGSNPPHAHPGQPVTVLYDPARPDVARLEGLVGSGTLVAVAVIVISTLFTGVSLIICAATYL